MQPSGSELVSGEGVRLALAPAGVGSRVVAAAIDLVIEAGALGMLSVITLAATIDDPAAGQAVFVTELVLVLAGYPIVMEWTTRGRTVGKIAMGLRVVRVDGGPIVFRHALVRGLAGLVLEKPGLFGPLTIVAGLLTMTGSAREQRIGDMMAGTVVLNERSAPQLMAPLPNWVPIPLQHWVLSLDMHRLDDRLALSARQFVSRAHAMSPAAQFELGEDIRRRVLTVTAPPPPPGTPTSVLLLSVLAERRRRAGGHVAVASPGGAHVGPLRPPGTRTPPSPGGAAGGAAPARGPAGPPAPASWPSRPDERPPFAPPA